MEDLEIKSSLKVSKLLSQFLENEVLNKLDLDVDKFWEDFDHVIKVFAPKNESLLKKREDIKKKKLNTKSTSLGLTRGFLCLPGCKRISLNFILY